MSESKLGNRFSKDLATAASIAAAVSFPVQLNLCRIATCNLNQWALDFDGNLKRVIQSILEAKRQGARYRLGPELELSGYSCEDHFLEPDTVMHCEQSLASLLQGDYTDDLLCDFGMPIIHNNVRYNSRVFCLNRKILLIRPKMHLAGDGNYREPRFFTAWDHRDRTLHDYTLSDVLQSVTGQCVVPIGVGVIATKETKIASEICEELWTPNSPHIGLFLSGVDIIANSSGSHHELRKLDSRLALMRSATRKCGGCYVYANHRGCDGTRLYFDGSSFIAINGELVEQASQFSLNDVEVISAVIDLDAIRAYRGTIASLLTQSAVQSEYPVVDIRHFSLRVHASASADTILHPSVIESRYKPRSMQIHSPEEECCMGPACWMWDYLRRSGAAGFLLPLSGGADSASVASIVRVMCVMVATAVVIDKNQQVIEDTQRIMKNNNTPSAVLDFITYQVQLQVSATSDKKRKLNAMPLSDNDADEMTNDATIVSASKNSSNESLAGKTDEDLVSIFANELCYQILHTIYLGTENSSINTQDRARRLASSIHSYHSNLVIDDIVSATLLVFSRLAGRAPRFTSRGGTMTEDLALQNIQARIRMVMSYMCAQLFPWLRGNSGYLLVLSSGNVDEALRGYMTKYDCSSGDLNPIGGISKRDLKSMLIFIANKHGLHVLEEIANAVPTAELRPIDGSDKSESTQSDEAEMGMTYDELAVFGYLRKVMKCGPVRMFLKLVDMWKDAFTPCEVAEKVKRFFYYYSKNRHKLTTLTPSYHAEGYSPDDNRFDLRPFLYNVLWTRQFNTIDSILKTTFGTAPAKKRELSGHVITTDEIKAPSEDATLYAPAVLTSQSTTPK